MAADGVLAAMLSGAAAGHAQVKRSTRAEALAEIAGALAQAKVKPGSDRASRVLAMAAAMYTHPSGPGDAAWYPVAVALLAEAGADLERARKI